jgi:hypothetical protein
MTSSSVSFLNLFGTGLSDDSFGVKSSLLCPS